MIRAAHRLAAVVRSWRCLPRATPPEVVSAALTLELIEHAGDGAWRAL